MRCSEVKRRLSNRAAVADTDIRDHLLACPSCAREAEAAGTLARIFASSRGEVPVPSLASVQKRVESRLTNQTTWEKIVHNIIDTYSARPRLALGFAATMAVLLFITLVPFSYTRTTGFQATISVAADQPPVSPKLAEGVLKALGYAEATVELRDGEALTVSNLPNESEARLIGRTIAQLSGSEADAQVTPVKEVKRTPLLAQVVDRVRLTEPRPIGIRFRDGHLVLNGEQLDRNWTSAQASDSSVRRDIEQILRHYLVSEDDMDVGVETNADSTVRIIRLTVGDRLKMKVDKPDVALWIRPDREVWATFDSLDDSIRTRLELEFPGKALDGRTVQIHVELVDK